MSTVLLILVLGFIAFIEFRDLLNNIVLPVNDPWLWFIESKEIALTGNLQAEPGSAAYGYFNRFPRGAVYFLAMMFLPNFINPYYIILFIAPCLSLLQSLGVYTASKKILNSDKLAIYSSLVYGTSRLVIWRGKIYITESLGLFLIIVLALFLFEKDLKTYILGLLVLSGLGLTSFSSLFPIILPILLWVVLYKSRKISVITITGIIGIIILLPNSVHKMMWRLLSATTFNPQIPSLSMFYDNSQWTFGYSLTFSFIGVIYFLIYRSNHSSERMFYVICFLELFFLINFVNLRFRWMNLRLFTHFSIFASTLTAQGLWNIIKVFRKVLPTLRIKGNVKSYLLHFIIAICLIYQIFFGMVRGYHATIARTHSYDDVATALWLYENSPEDAVILITIDDRLPYSSILYPRTVIRNPDLYKSSLSVLVIYCSQNDIDYLVLKFDEFTQSIKADNHFTEIYKNTNRVIVEFSL
jgi:hypothetical protein